VSPKTILIIIDRWVSYRDMVFTGVISRLQSKGYDISLGITPAVTMREEDMARLQSVKIVNLDLSQSGLGAPVARLLDKLSHKVMRDLMSLEHPDITLNQTRENRWMRRGKTPLMRRFYAVILLAMGLHWRHVSNLALHWGTYTSFGKTLDQLQPDALVYSNMLIGSADYLKEARRRGIQLILDVPSWDNPTSKGPMTVGPDHALAWSENMKAELVAYHNIPADRVRTSGVLAYDGHFHPSSMSCDEIRASMGIPKDKHIILYTLGTPNQAACMTLFIERLLELIRKHIPNAVLVVRISPRDNDMTMRKFSSDPLLFINRPSGTVSPVTGNWMPDENETLERVTLMRCSSVVVAMQSSIVLEACCCDRPVINLAYDAGLTVPHWESVERFYRYSHALPVIDTGGTWIVRSDEDLSHALQSYLAGPALHRENRRALLEHACQYADGFSMHRWVDALDDIVQNPVS